MEDILVPNPSKHDVSSFTVLINDKEMSSTYQVLSITITKEINRIPVARLMFRDGDAASRKFDISNSADFIPGNKIKIKIGRDGDNSQFFKGVIIKHAIKVRENGNGELMVECRDDAVRMCIGRHSRYFDNLKDNEVFDELIGKYKKFGLKSDSEQTRLKHKHLVQHHISDWDFLMMRAEANGLLVRVDDGEIKIFKPLTNAEPALQLAFGSSVLEFEGEMDARYQWKNVQAKSWDYNNQQLFTASSESPKYFAEPGNIKGESLSDTIDLSDYELHHSGFLLEQELQSWVNGAMLRSRIGKNRGRVRFSGFAGVKPGDMVKIDGVSDRFNGKAFVTSVRQEVGNGSWDTHIQFGLDQQAYAESLDDINDKPTSGLLGNVHGLQIGIVVQLQNDPDGQDRILVRTPVIDNRAQGIWMRIASLDAGNERGAFFRPELNDEVIVGFINGDPRHGVVLGMLNSSAKPAPLKAQDQNNEKGFTTRSKMHLLFDDQKKQITIDTPAGNKIVLDESGTKIEIKDQQSNSITLDSSGIKLNSPMSIEIKAGVNLTLSAAASLSIGGTSLSVKADGDVSVTGAMAKLSAQGPTVISGLPVKIN